MSSREGARKLNVFENHKRLDRAVDCTFRAQQSSLQVIHRTASLVRVDQCKI